MAGRKSVSLILPNSGACRNSGLGRSKIAPGLEAAADMGWPLAVGLAGAASAAAVASAPAATPSKSVRIEEFMAVPSVVAPRSGARLPVADTATACLGPDKARVRKFSPPPSRPAQESPEFADRPNFR